MKRLIVIALLATMMIGVTGCGNSKDTSSSTTTTTTQSTEAKSELDKIVGRVAAIITNSANGEDPETTDVHQGCSGDCSGCSSCG
mgnify:CR=1 FL=1